MKRTTGILLLLAILLASCGTKTPSSETMETVSADTAANTVKEDLYLDDLPDDVNLNGESIRFLYRAEISNEFYVDEITGEIVEDAVFESITTVEERLNAKMAVTLMDGHYMSARQPYKDHITNSIIAGDDQYEWVDMMSGSGAILQQEGVFMNLLNNPVLDFEKPYYIRDLVENLSVKNRLYFLSGDASLGYMRTAFCLYFNKETAENYNVEDLYTLVDSGAWTVDKAKEISAQCIADLNGDGKYNLDDTLGFVVHDRTHMYGFMNSTYTHVYRRDAANEWEYTFGTEADYDNMVRLNSLIFGTDGNYYYSGSNAVESEQATYNQITNKFITGEIFMITAEMDDAVVSLRDMEANYGILPMPKSIETQDTYYSGSRSTHNIFAMPITTQKAENAAVFMEALSAQKHTSTLPAYFEVALKNKYSRDNESSRMYDIIHDGMILNFSYLYTSALGIGTIFEDGVKKPDTFYSTAASKQSSIEAKFNEYLEKIEDLSE